MRHSPPSVPPWRRGRVLTAILLSALACTGEPAEKPEVSTYDFIADEAFADLDEAVRDCGRIHCRTEPEREAAAQCLETSCPEVPTKWTVKPSAIRYQEGTVFVSANVEHVPGSVAGQPRKRTQPVFVGVTVIRETGEEVDLAVSTLFPEGLDAPITLSADVGARVQDIVIGAWSTKIEPCNVDRSGCRDFGFVLDDSLATWPPHFYRDWLRQRIPTQPVTVAFEGGDPAQRQTAEASMNDYLAVFSVSASLQDATPAPAEKPTVRHRHPSDALLARAVARALGDLEVASGAETADIEVVFTGGE